MSVEDLLTLEEDKDLEQSTAEESGEAIEDTSPPEEEAAQSEQAEEDEYATIEDARELRRLLRDKAKSEKGILAAKADEVRKRQRLEQQNAHYQGQLASVRQMIEMAQRQQQQGQQPSPQQQQTLQQKLDALDIPIEFDDDGNPKAKLSADMLKGLLKEQLRPVHQFAQQAEMQRRQQMQQQAFQRFLTENPERAEAVKVYEDAKGFVDAKIEDFIGKSGYPREHVIAVFRKEPGKFHEFLDKSGIGKEFRSKYKFPIENVLEYSGVKVDPYRRLDAMLQIARGNQQQNNSGRDENRQFVKNMQRKPNNLLGAGGGKGSKDKYDLADQISVHDLYGLPRDKINQIKKALSSPD